MSKPDKQSCENCQCYIAKNDLEGHCHYDPPIRVLAEDGTVRAAWPFTQPGQWCRKWENDPNPRRKTALDKELAPKALSTLPEPKKPAPAPTPEPVPEPAPKPAETGTPVPPVTTVPVTPEDRPLKNFAAVPKATVGK